MALQPRLHAPADVRAPGALRDHLLAFLLKHECLNNMLIANCLGDVPVDFILTLEDAERAVHFAAAQTAGRAVLVSTCEESLFPEALRAIDHASRSFPGVVGPEPVARHIAHHLSRTPKLFFPLGVYACSMVILPPRMPEGKQVTATQEHANLLKQWMIAFGRDVGEPCPLQQAESYVATHLASGSFKLWLNAAGEPVSSGCYKGNTPNGVRISFVYTPPEQRKHGYAAANVALLTQSLLSSGRKFVFLFTDMNNPTSNALYQRIGFVLQGNSAHYHL